MGCFRIYGDRKSEMLKKFQHDSDIAFFEDFFLLYVTYSAAPSPSL
jgi:hypothetical protein